MRYCKGLCAALLMAGMLLAAPVFGGLALAGPAPIVVMETNMGQIVIMLDEKNAPITVKNFLQYVEEGFYRGTLFHRVIDNRDMAIVQGGGFEFPMQRKRTNMPIKNEAGMAGKNRRGTIAMARSTAVDSATSQFFFNVRDNIPFDHAGNDPQKYGYAVFGKVIRGMDVVDEISKVETGRSGMFHDVPKKPVFIKKAYRK